MHNEVQQKPGITNKPVLGEYLTESKKKAREGPALYLGTASTTAIAVFTHLFLDCKI